MTHGLPMEVFQNGVSGLPVQAHVGVELDQGKI